MATALLILHGLVAVALLGAITHQTLAAWASFSARPRSFFDRFRAVPPAGYANAIVGLRGHRTAWGGRLPVLQGLDRYGHTWRARDRLYSCANPRSLVSLVLARMAVGRSGPRNDGVRLPDYSLVPTIGKIFAPIVGNWP